MTICSLYSFDSPHVMSRRQTNPHRRQAEWVAECLTDTKSLVDVLRSFSGSSLQSAAFRGISSDEHCGEMWLRGLGYSISLTEMQHEFMPEFPFISLYLRKN